MELKNKTIVLIADTIMSHEDAGILNSDLECPTEKYCDELIKELRNIGNNVFHYNNLNDFIDNLSQHKDDIILSIYSGKNTKSRKVYIPSICEASNICYAGANPFAQAICCDKYLSKRYCENFGIRCSKDVLIMNETDLMKLKYLKLPFIIKPNNEGGSNGIGKQNFIKSYSEGERIGKMLLTKFNPLIAEEIIEGSEITIALIGKQNEGKIVGQTQIDIIDDNKIFGFEAKKSGLIKTRKKQVFLLSEKEKQQIIDIFNSFGKVDYMRVDGIYNEDGFHLIELSPDANISKDASFSYAFFKSGKSYSKMLSLILESSINNYQLNNAKKK